MTYAGGYSQEVGLCAHAFFQVTPKPNIGLTFVGPFLFPLIQNSYDCVNSCGSLSYTCERDLPGSIPSSRQASLQPFGAAFLQKLRNLGYKMGSKLRTWLRRREGMTHTVSDNEWTLMRLLQAGIVPFGVAAAIGGFAAFNQLSAAQAETKAEVTHLTQQREDVTKQVTKLTTKQEQIITQQNAIQVTVKEVETNQKHIQEDILEVKEQNREILRILRER